MIKSVKGNRSENGNALFLGTLSLVFIIPLMGLAIDASFLYAVKGRMQAAADGAALGAARALNMGQTLTSQQTAAAQNAVNWFYANFPPGTYLTTNTVMSTAGESNSSSGFGAAGQSVHIYPDASNPQLDHVDLQASTDVPTFFMKWFGVNKNTITVVAQATRRAVVAMIVLDRSGSMCKASAGGTQNSPCDKTGTTYPCYAMIQAAKQFTGQFSEGRDYIGMISFAHNTYIHSVPTTSFQTKLGYTSSFGSGTGEIDNIVCNGGTGTAQAISQAYQLLYQTGLPGALNILLLETDGLPNTLTMNFYDSVNGQVGLSNGSSCTDTNNKTKANGGFSSSAKIPNWTSGLALNAAPFLTTTGVYSNIPSGMIGAVPSADVSSSALFWVMDKYFTSSSANNYDTYGSIGADYLTTATNCSFNTTSGGTGYIGTNPSDIAWWPAKDVYGNSTNPSNAYKSVTTDGYGHVLQSGSSPTNWTNYHNAVLNATDNAAYVARSNATNPAYVFAIGLGGNSVTGPPDPVLMQRIANDPSGDTFNASPYYSDCANETGCITNSSQYQGTFVYTPSSSQLTQAFLQISSQILRLNK